MTHPNYFLHASIKTLLFTLSITTALVCHAESAPGTAAASAGQSTSTRYPAIEAKMKERVPNLKIEAIEESQIPGLFAVIAGREVIYVDKDVKFVINGHVFDAASRQDLTADMIASRNKIDVKSLPLADSFSEVRGNGARQLYVFSDPDCPYCKQLETEMPKLTDVTVHVFLFPLESLHPNARINSVGVWCSQDRTKAWEDKMTKDILPPPGSCDTPVDRNLKLAEKLGIAGTPTLIFADGKMLSGTMSAQQINVMLGGS